MPNIVIEIPREDLALYRSLKDIVNVELLKGKTRINTKDSYCDKFFNTAEYFVELFECGGGKTNTGEATIICDCDGLPLRPVEIYTSGHLANSEHAKFLIKKGVEITVNHKHQVRISVHQPVEEGERIKIHTDLLWEGKMENFPESLRMFQEAVKTGYQKCRCYHCREPHYIL